MNSSNHPAAYGYRPPVGPRQSPVRKPVESVTLREAMLPVEKKSFLVSLSENAKGRLLRVTERKGNHYATIIVPATGLKEFQAILADMLEAEAKLPPTPAPAPTDDLRANDTP